MCLTTIYIPTLKNSLTRHLGLDYVRDFFINTASWRRFNVTEESAVNCLNYMISVVYASTCSF